MAERVSVKIENRQLSISNLDKVLYPTTGFTKGELIDYYTRSRRRSYHISPIDR